MRQIGNANYKEILECIQKYVTCSLPDKIGSSTLHIFRSIKCTDGIQPVKENTNLETNFSPDVDLNFQEQQLQLQN